MDHKDETKRADLKRHWAYEATDLDLSHEIYRDDAVLEFPQSRERFEGKANFLAWRKLYPAALEFKVRRIRGREDFWVAENTIRYDDGLWNYTCSILEFKGDKVARETIYIVGAWEAPDWRAPWRAPWQDESLDQPLGLEGETNRYLDIDDTARVATLRQGLDFEASDIEQRHELYHEDAILEFPQSKERFEGRQSFLSWRKQYPANVEFKVRRIRGRGDLWAAEASVRYDGGPWNFGLGIHEFKGDKVSRETVYGGEGWEAPDWRAPWRAPWQDESSS